MSAQPVKHSVKTTVILVVAAVVAMALLAGGVLWLRAQRTSASADATVDPDPYVSQVDRDGDGVDDQTDFLAAVRAYVATKPKYRSAYYAGGYPDDGYGVCTDVVAFGMRDAGYDLRQLVADDIAAHPDWYGVEVPDADIDFRRVPNLDVYLAHHAISLTTDPQDTTQWKGGDIVVYENHIGVVSDRRDARNVPLLIHHSGATQRQYEEDVLASFPQRIVGHYRIS